MNLSNLTIRSKLTLAFGALCLMVLGVAGMAVQALSAANDRFEDFVTGINARATLARQVRTAVDRRAIAARNLVLVTKPADLEKEKALVTQAHADVRELLEKLKATVNSDKGATDRARELVRHMDSVESSYGPVALAIVELALNQKKDEAIGRMNEECRPLLAALSKASADYSEYSETRAQALVKEAESRFASQRMFLILACLAVAAAAATAGVLVTRAITRPLGEALRFAESVAAGDLSVQLTKQGKDELAQLLTALGKMSVNLGGIVHRVRQSSDSIATGSAQIASGNADLSQRTEQQAGSLQQTASTMEQLGTTVRNNAESAKQANELAVGASGIASKGGNAVEQVVLKMKGINSSSRKIADIISVIDGIAFQTNILALNAAVEAARAGEQGRGFAVVASEVRSLAQRSAAAAKEIKTLITDSVEQVDQGTNLVDEAGRTMSEIVASIKRVSDIVAEISSASAEQSRGVDQVGQAVTQMDQVTQQNAALVEESAAAAESLRTQAAQLVLAVATFKLAPA
ncbi:MAG: MCP four helix bundle domain-containing protein [Rhizobacter sp.]|nr:MCP four helix bundle domain-containing protein [Rhizobacter sp.]